MGARAFSHDSIFIPDGGAESEQTFQAMSQDNILGKVKTLQQQLGKNIKFGQRPPKAIPMKKADSGEASLEEDLSLTSPMEIVTHQDLVLSDTENKASDTPSSPSPLNLPGAGSEMEEKVAPVKPSRPKRHLSPAGTIESVNLDAVPLVIARLDNSAAKHKLSVRPKNQRVSRKHRRLAPDRHAEHGGLAWQNSLAQNGHPGEDKSMWQEEEEPTPLDPEEEKRRQEEYWRELEAKCRRQKAEAAEKRRLEEQRLQALERRLWEENRRQELLEEAAEEEGELQVEEHGGRHPEQREPEEGEGSECLQELEAQQLEERCPQQEQMEAERQREQEREVKEPRGLEALEARKRQEEEEKRLEAQRQQEEERRLEAQRRQEEEERRLEAKRLQEEDEKRLEAHRQQEEERRLEAQRKQEEKTLEAQRQQKEDRRLEQLETQRQQEEERRLEELRQQEEERRLEAQRQQEEERRLEQLEAQRRQEEEEEERRLETQRQQEEERKRMEELRRQQEEATRREELKRQEEIEAQRRQEAKELQEVPGRLEAESTLGLEPTGGRFQGGREKPEQPENLRAEGQRGSSEDLEILLDQSQETMPAREQRGTRRDLQGEPHPALEEEEKEGAKVTPPQADAQDQPREEALPLPPVEKEQKAPGVPETDRRVEELRWQEVDERQTMPRPYTFQVSSGGRQILFPKVNLSPVTPAKDAGLASAPQEPKAPKASLASHALPSALSIPHTAILVTGAQLCGPAVNLSQIKDTACKSLLGLSEEKKHVDVPTADSPPRAPGDRAGSGKARLPQESPSALAEWASIRSRILKNTEGDLRGDREGDQSRPGEEVVPRGRCDSRGNLRKTPPVNAKFSIMPAWQKFSDGSPESSRPSSEAEGIRKRPVQGPSEEPAPQPPPPRAQEHRKGPEKLEAPQEPVDSTEGCKFAKDLPSFLVPSPPYPLQKAAAHAEAAAASDSVTAAKPDAGAAAGEEKASPFGIKLRRTNYSLRFHCDPQAEQKKKKRHSSTGDGDTQGAGGERDVEGAAPRPGPPHPQEKKPTPTTATATSMRRDSAESPASGHGHAPAAQPRPPPTGSQVPEPDKTANKMPAAQKPALAPKPTSQTPPSSPLSKLSRPYLVELLARRAGKPEPEPSPPSKEGQASSDPRPPAAEERQGQRRDAQEETLERKPASPPLSASQPEKPARTPEAGRREKPLLQSRHSVDGSKLLDKAEAAQPLWITLALQKQKGFREQQATREERKQAREAKQAEKLSKENVSVSPQPGSSGVSRAGSLHRPGAQPAEKQPETAASRLERREQLKKANTLPTSVTVEISDSAPPTPPVKDVTKRFSTPDAAPVSTEPAWLALAKRKAKAWSDCPQIIK